MKAVEIKKEPNPVLVEMLEQLLNEAKAGDFQSILFVLHNKGLKTGSGYVYGNGHNKIQMLGALEALKFDLALRTSEQNETSYTHEIIQKIEGL